MCRMTNLQIPLANWSSDYLQAQLLIGHLTICDQFTPVTNCDSLWPTVTNFLFWVILEG